METVSLGIAVVDLACWGVCFWWMHTISRRQNELLAELKAQGDRIENVSVEEHKLVKELHPTVASIKDDMREVTRAVSE